jgi:hypothetical protein
LPVGIVKRETTAGKMRVHTNKLSKGFLFTALLGGCFSASAETVPGAYASGFLNETPFGTSFGSFTSGELAASVYYAGGTGFLSLSQTTYITSSNDLENGSAHLGWSFEVLGPASSNVPLLYTVSGLTSASSGIGSSASVYAWLGSGINSPDIYSISACAFSGFASCSVANNSFSVNHPFTVETNTIYYVTIGVGGTSNSGAFSALVDPAVTFGPNFNSSGYSIVNSADVLAAPVPLPASAWLMLTGLAGLSVMARRREA